MFEKITAAPPDAILGLSEAFKKDANPNKINLGVGVYKDAYGNTPILATAKKAEQMLLSSESSKSYLPIDGNASYDAAAQALILGPDHEIVASGRAVTVQTPGGTGALRVAGDFIAKNLPGACIWLSAPTWPNHPAVFTAAGVEQRSYPYFNKATNDVDFEAMLNTIKQIPAGDILLLHGCCHNPTGVDLSLAQWKQVGDVIAENGVIPLVDFAYQGFANGIDEDASGLRELCRPGAELLIASSFSKNFGLYNERVGALTVVAGNAESAQTALSQVKIAVRRNYSNPPAHGGAIVATVLTDPELRAAWEQELADMRDRVNTMRGLFVETLNEKGVTQDFSFIAGQRGMFSFSGLNPEQVQALRDKYAIYIVGSGRINVAGMTEANMDYLCTAIADVLEG